MVETKPMTVDEFKAECRARNARAYFHEVGRDGWTDLGDVVNHLVEGAPPPRSKKGPHWIDGCAPNQQRLIGKLDVNAGLATFF